MKNEHWFWIGGWGIPPRWFQTEIEKVIPDAEHTFVPPTADAFSEFDPTHFSRIGGYSLGAFLLLQNAEKIPQPALLLAPFFAYPLEESLGGKINRTQIRYLRRWLRRAPLEALSDFYKRAKLALPEPTKLPYALEDLEWGLTQLADKSVPPRMPKNWRGIVGRDDPLLDAVQIIELEPRIQITPTAGHHPTELLSAVQSQ